MTDDSIFVFVAEMGDETSHFFVEADSVGNARTKLNSRFPDFGDAECLGSPEEIMDLHKPDVVMA